RYQLSRRRSFVPSFVYPNGIDLKNIASVRDRREEVFNFIFMCGTFSSWHGLDLLIDELEHFSLKRGAPRLQIHLVGNVLSSDLARIGQLPRELRNAVVCHGHLKSSGYSKLLEQCDIGLSSFAL